MISLYSRGHSLLSSKLARGTTTSPLGENLKSASVERRVLWGRMAEILITLPHLIGKQWQERQTQIDNLVHTIQFVG
jgi:hypothetical protein